MKKLKDFEDIYRIVGCFTTYINDKKTKLKDIQRECLKTGKQFKESDEYYNFRKLHQKWDAIHIDMLFDYKKVEKNISKASRITEFWLEKLKEEKEFIEYTEKIRELEGGNRE